jgi:hypothetical protein
MADWTPACVEARLHEAADVMQRLPEVRVQGYYSLWPTVLTEFSDLVGQEPPRLKRPPPSPSAISRMEETLGWLRWLEAEDAKLVWARSDRTPWKAICWRFGIGRATAHRRWQYGLCLIAWRLNGRRAPTKRSRSFVVESVRRASSLSECLRHADTPTCLTIPPDTPK